MTPSPRFRRTGSRDARRLARLRAIVRAGLRGLGRSVPCCAALAILASSPSSSAQVALPVEITGASFANAGDVKTYTVDLSSVPNRPALLVEVTPDAAHPDLETEIVVTSFLPATWTGPGPCPGPTDTFGDVDAGVHAYQFNLWDCEPRLLPPGYTTPYFDGKTVQVSVRVTDFGAAGQPATADLSIRGITTIPWNSYAVEVDYDLTPQSVWLTPSKDTVLYDGASTTSNGQGDYLWAGTDYVQIGVPPFQARFWNRRNTLVAFDVDANTVVDSTISNATLWLYASQIVGTGGGVYVYEAAASGTPGVTWGEGFADAAGDEFYGVDGGPSAANWDHRQGAQYPWATAGGDTTGSVLASQSIDGLGWKTWSSAALTSVVQTMADSGEDQDGFLIRGPGSPFFSGDLAIRFNSGDAPSLPPYLNYTYTPNSPYVDGEQFASGAVSYISEGQNFRWIYDTDDDGIYVTTIGGVCEELAPGTPTYVPYTYSYTGGPYTGIDCCTWQIDSPQTGTVGTGQALFYHGLDPLNPANAPVDSDTDGIMDGCDNCPSIPNGPLIGSCMGPMGIGATCLSDLECPAGATCERSQLDSDTDGTGDACAVPEPGFAVLIASGALGVAFAARRPRRTAAPPRFRP